MPIFAFLRGWIEVNGRSPASRRHFRSIPETNRVCHRQCLRCRSFDAGHQSSLVIKVPRHLKHGPASNNTHATLVQPVLFL